MILKKSVVPRRYLLKNRFNTKISNLINTFNKQNKKKLKIKWHSNSLIKCKIYPYDKLKNWKPNNSSINDIIHYIKF